MGAKCCDWLDCIVYTVRPTNKTCNLIGMLELLFGDNCCCCCCGRTAILPVDTRMYLACDTIIMDFSSSRPVRCFVPSLYTNLYNRSITSYFQ